MANDVSVPDEQYLTGQILSELARTPEDSKTDWKVGNAHVLYGKKAELVTAFDTATAATHGCPIELETVGHM